MKVRSGFVSNSSSSSFVLVVPVKDHEAAMEKLSSETRQLMLKVLHCTTARKLGDSNVIVITGETEEDICRIGDFDIYREWENLFPGQKWYEQGEAFFDEYRKLLPSDRIIYESEYR